MSRDNAWEGRPWAARLVKLVAYLGPFVVAVLVTIWISRQMPPPESFAAAVGAWLLLGVVATVIVQVLDRLARRLLPFAALLQLSLAFPGEVPSRYKVARTRGGSRELEAEVDRAREEGLSDDRTEAAVTVLRLVGALSTHDRATRGHAERVRVFVDMIAEEMDLDEADVDRLRWSALLHDIGKIAVHPDVLNDPGRPSEEAWELLRTHPLEGARITAPLRPWLGHWALAIEQHHERWDGDGYPYGIAGEDLSLGARIVTVADAYDVMTAARAYKQPLPAHEARKELARHAGTQFDPEVVRAFLGIPLNRLRWAIGPFSWFVSTPFGRPFQALSSGVGAVAATAAAAAVGIAGVGLPVGDLAPLPEIADVEEPVAEPQPEPEPGTAPQSDDPQSDDPQSDDPQSDDPPSDDPQSDDAQSDDGGSFDAQSDGSQSDGPQSDAPEPDEEAAPPPAAAPAPAPTPTSAPPPLVVTDEDVTIEEDTVLTLDVLANDRLDRARLLRLLDVLVRTGTLEWDGDGVITWTPPRDFFGTTVIEYVVGDGDATATGRVRLSVTPVNDPPVVTDDIATVTEDTPQVIDLLGDDTDPDGDTLRIVRFDRSRVTNGTVTDNGDGTILYTPNPDATGVDTLVYWVSDGTVEVAGTLDVAVVAVDDPPRPVADEAVVDEDGSVAIDVLANDVEVDGDVLRVSSVSLPGATTSVRGGVVTVVPAPDTNGVLRGTVTVTDGRTPVSSRLTVRVRAVNDPPTITPGGPVAVVVDAGPVAVPGWASGISPGPSDEAGQTLTATTTVDQPALFAALPILDPATGDLRFAFAPGVTGTATTTITLTDDGGTARGGSDRTTVTTTISAVPAAPDAIDDAVTIEEDTAAVIRVLDNDVANGGTLRVVAVDDSATTLGTVIDLGGGNVRYVPDPDANGTDTFTYTVDNGVGTDTATVTVRITPVPDDPIAVDDLYSTTAGTTLVVDAADGVLFNDSDPDGDAVSVVAGPLVQSGVGDVGSIAADGSFTYTPPAGFTGDARLTYTVTDGARTATGRINVAVGEPLELLFLQGAPVDPADPATSPLSATSPTVDSSAPVGEWDWDADGDPGLTIDSGNGRLTEPNPRKYQEWVSTPSTDLSLDGPVAVRLTSVTRDVTVGEAVEYTVGLFECLPDTTCTLLAGVERVLVENWNPAGTWSTQTLPLGDVEETIEAGNTLRLRLVFSRKAIFLALTSDRPSTLLYSTPS